MVHDPSSFLSVGGDALAAVIWVLTLLHTKKKVFIPNQEHYEKHRLTPARFAPPLHLY